VHTLIMPAKERRAGRRDRESGSTAVEFVFLTPLLMIILLALVQIAMYVFAQHVAATAAQAAARAGREDQPADPGGWTTASRDAADSWINDLIGGAAGDVKVTPTLLAPVPNTPCTPPTITVTVTFSMAALLGSFQAHGQSQGPVENFYPDC
jgi:Flp pilus assembly protein TadG